jgi:hypothetical protein
MGMIKKMIDWLRSPQITIRGKTFHLPLPTRMPRIRLPGFHFGMPRLGNLQLANSKVKYIILGTVMVSVSVVGVGMWFAVKDVVSSSYDWPRAGASYALGSPLGTMGEQLDNYEDDAPSQTLQVNLADGVRISTLTFENLDMGRTGLTDCVVVQRGAGTGYLYVDDVVMTGVSAPSLDWANSEIGTLAIAGSTDGHTFGATIDSTIADQVVVSTRGSGTFEAKNTSVDRLILSLAGDATVGTLTFNNVKCSVGGWNIDYVKASTLTQDASSQFGTGSGIDSADYVLQSTLSYRSATDSILDTPIQVR